MRMRQSTSSVRAAHPFLRWLLGADDLRLFVDDPQLFHGLPVGLQLVGRTLEEEGVIAMTEVVDKALKALK